MELKVWVDGVQRVVCGVTAQTSCQDVVIALAQAIGQTGRYVLIQTLRDKERQLLPHERPLEFLSKSGQYANDVHFILKRTGPSLTERPSSDSGPLPPERTFVRSSLPLNPKVHSTEVTRSKEPKKSLTFNLGPMSSSDLLLKHRQKQQNGTVAKDSSSKQTTKDDIFKLVLQQQEQLKAMEMQNTSLGKDLQTWERGRVGGPHEEDEDEVAFLERLIRRNESELGEEMFWLDELDRERADEQKRQEKMRNLRTTMEDYTMKINELSERTEALEKEIQRETSKRLSGQPSQADIAEMVTKMRKEMEAKAGQSHQMETNLSNVEKACEEAKRILETKSQELEELNKDLRQCNLQQFIQQTGSTITNGQLRPSEESLNEQSLSQWEEQFGSIGHSESLPRLTTNHLMGHPRNLQNSLLSGRNPEVLPSRDTSWT
ncbi:PREDICTED: ras association domain-containing protein 7 [Nanorana parkeri]|uniref:ras association domain-containing protein 7 n=1 Tax=Nanorana parkeri TaxID=125878 RepID=UPI000854287D|nr:PREDICTED: ras association domain-containing protein 7 [Nanorana parkeri]